MLPLHELLSHAESSRMKSEIPKAAEGRRANRRQRYGNLTLYPCLSRSQPTDASEPEVAVIASLSNVSSTGIGVLHSVELPVGMEFDVQWKVEQGIRSLRFQVMHSRPTGAGIFRTGARLVAGELPAEPEAPARPVRAVAAEVVEPIPVADEEPPAPSTSSGIMQLEAELMLDAIPPRSTPAGTYPAAIAGGFDKTEALNGVTTCGWERNIELRRVGSRLWIYIHSPGKNNGWGIFVDPHDFDAAWKRIQQAADSPFITTLAA